MFNSVMFFFGAVALVVVVGMLLSLPVFLLWNYCLVGAVVGVKEITWLQAWGLFVLCNFLFKTSFNKKGE